MFFLKIDFQRKGERVRERIWSVSLANIDVGNEPALDPMRGMI